VVNQNYLCQIEVEYSGTYLSGNQQLLPKEVVEQDIIDDIAYITNELLTRFTELKPSILTKQEWSIENY
jgi:hypothetical protein